MIVSIGEALIDFKGEEFYVGGGPLNTAVAASRLGSQVLFLGGISSDFLGSQILSFIKDNDIEISPAFCNDSKRTMTTKAVSKNGVNHYEFVYQNTTAFSITKSQLQTAFSTFSNINCIFAGSVSFINPKTRANIIAGIKTLYQPVVFFDPNIRENLIEDRNEYIEGITEFASMADIVKVSDDDISTWGYSPEELLSKCKRHLIVTHGENGSTWYEKNEEPISVKASKPWHRIVDTIGCGDCYNGAIISWLDRRGKFEDFRISATDKKLAMEFASECSAYNCTREGCNPPYYNEITA